ncbi:hypothetical protein RRG08_032171 [Elysia crispata]|uniref:Uncharacterized protein n=1 Tax=Elysia crispata TaxID=231223 RepID=A0AAE1AB79_9GAST|nr:hypothetical protein RRG08_032171 [Elysia crispata]
MYHMSRSPRFSGFLKNKGGTVKDQEYCTRNITKFFLHRLALVKYHRTAAFFSNLHRPQWIPSVLMFGQHSQGAARPPLHTHLLPCSVCDFLHNIVTVLTPCDAHPPPPSLSPTLLNASKFVSV